MNCAVTLYFFFLLFLNHFGETFSNAVDEWFLITYKRVRCKSYYLFIIDYCDLAVFAVDGTVS